MRPHIWSLQLRVSPARKARWQHLAAADNRTLSNWIAHTIEDATAETPDTIEDAGAQAETPIPDTIEHAGAQTEAPHVALQPPRPGALPPDTLTPQASRHSRSLPIHRPPDSPSSMKPHHIEALTRA